MNAAVLMPWWDSGCGHRRLAFSHVFEYVSKSFPCVIVGHNADVAERGFSAAASTNALVKASTADVFLRWEAEIDVPIANAREALDRAAASPGLFAAHTSYHYLTEGATSRLLRRGLPAPEGWLSPHDVEFEGTGSVGGVVAFSRATWEEAGGYDERFGRWGGDDAAFAYACSLAGEGGRVRGRLVHLWHPRPPESIPGAPGYAQQFAVVAAYRDAAAQGTLRGLIAARPQP